MALTKIELPKLAASMSLSWQPYMILVSDRQDIGILRGAKVDEVKVRDKSETGVGIDQFESFVVIGTQHNKRERLAPKSVKIPLATDPELEPQVLGDYVRYGEIVDLNGVKTVVGRKPNKGLLTRSFRTGGLRLHGGTVEFRRWVRRQQLQPYQYCHCAFALEKGMSLEFIEGESVELVDTAELMYDVATGNLFKDSPIPFTRERAFKFPDIGNRDLGAPVLEGNFGLLLLHQQVGNQIEVWDATGDPTLEKKYEALVTAQAEVDRERLRSAIGNKEARNLRSATMFRAQQPAKDSPPSGDPDAR